LEYEENTAQALGQYSTVMRYPVLSE